ncbi:MAG: alkaline phosphatase family protein [Candidatus Promineifilaceae bacterium]|nr:alkaline phosphatase family protein [Candidatus Promineifilaceae bacterium]
MKARLLFILWLALFARGVTAQSADDLPLEYVVHISVDGLRADLLAERLENDAQELYPNFARLREEGAYTLNGRTDDSHTNTLPNHTSMLTGRPVTAVAAFPVTAFHGYTDNKDPRWSWTLHNQGNPAAGYFSSTFDVAHDYGLRTALFASKSKFVIYDQSYNERTGAPDMIGEDNGRDKIDQFVANENTADLINQFVSEMAEEPYHYSFVHMRDTDSAGHEHGWGSTQWDDALQRIDGYVGQILDAVQDDELLRGKTAVILTSDHGGDVSNHWNQRLAVNYTIPVFLWSPEHIPAGVDLYDLYARSFADPEGAKGAYDEKPQPLRNGSTGNHALYLLGLPPIPGSMIDAPHFITHCGIEAGEKYDFGETLAQIEVIEPGTEGCVSVGAINTTAFDDWRVVPYGADYELKLILPDGEEQLLTLETCVEIRDEAQICQEYRLPEAASGPVDLLTTLSQIFRQTLPWLAVALIGILAMLLLIALTGFVVWQRDR